MSEGKDPEQDRRNQLTKTAIGVAALLSVGVGLTLYIFAEDVGYDKETAQFVAIAFLVAGFGDYILLRFWDRLQAMRRKRGRGPAQ